MIRVGVGYDSHRFAAPGPLILGGATIEHDYRLSGHSDGDAVAHALIDAILGAAGAGDVGEMFPDTDERYRGADSIELLRVATAHVRSLGWSVSHVDVVIVTEAPKIAPHRSTMRSALGAAMAIGIDAVSVKGKTNERMGWIGRGEGLACIAVATIESVGG